MTGVIFLKPVAGALIGVALLALTGACGGERPGNAAVPSPTATELQDARARLAARAAAAKDRRYSATYALSGRGRPAGTVSVALATDGTWRVDVPGGALGGTQDVAIISIRDGIFQCALAVSSCVKIANSGQAVPARYDPWVQHPFVDWIDVLMNRDGALSVAAAPALDGATGACFSVEPTTASVAAPLDPGVYCYETDGTLTGARFGAGTLALTGTPGPPPPTVSLPGLLSPGPALPTAAPSPSPTPSVSVSSTAAPSPSR